MYIQTPTVKHYNLYSLFVYLVVGCHIESNLILILMSNCYIIAILAFLLSYGILEAVYFVVLYHRLTLFR